MAKKHQSNFPSWLHQGLNEAGFNETSFDEASSNEIKSLLRSVNTVCEEAKCPNRLICFKKRHATFLALGKKCTRHCSFCDIEHSQNPLPPDPLEPKKIASVIKKLKLQHAVITMVTRDDLKDQGALHLAKIIQEIKKQKTSIEVLTSDFSGNTDSLDLILKEKPLVFNHNIETVASLTPKIRDKASFQRSLSVLKYVKEKDSSIYLKSGLMVGLGEEEKEVLQTIKLLKEVGCDIITIGQYLRPSSKCLKVKEFIPPEQFEKYKAYAKKIGIKYISAGPFVRSSFNAENILK